MRNRSAAVRPQVRPCRLTAAYAAGCTAGITSENPPPRTAPSVRKMLRRVLLHPSGLCWLRADSLLSLLTLLGGFLMTYLWMDTGDAASVVSAHLPADGLHPLLFWLRVTLSLLPAWFMLGLSGLCCCGGTLCAGILALRGLCDGAALGALALTEAPVVPFLTRMLLLLVVRLLLSLWSRATAGDISDPALQHAVGQRGPSPLMLRHLTGVLAAGIAGAAVCMLYTALVYLT